ncbi:uncharacterized protein LOC132545358 [Ylistrum balloti]|uniref:uncharacterized protein LOC132545358 n=1 Tax=Ylistrum balloti TaxID=509963 RepID=UPI002905BDDC|nr:uncharacterized protein LOC132545358 [Ylistrum balloti]
MKRAILVLFRAFFVIPFTAGTRRRSSGSFRLYDCSTSSTVMFLLLLASIIVFTGSLSIANGAVQRILVIKVILTFLDVAGIITCTLTGCLIYKHGVPYTDLSISNGSRKSKYLQLGFLWLFAVLSVVLFSFKTAVEIDCWNSFSWIQTIDSSFRIMIILCYTTILHYMSRHRFKKVPLLNYAVRVLICIYICFWINSFIRSKTFINPNSLVTHNHTISDWLQCALNSTSGLIYYNSKKYVFPAYAEFLILSVTLLNEFSSMISSNVEKDKENGENNDNNDSTENNGIEERKPLLSVSYQIDGHSVSSSTQYSITMIVALALALLNLVFHILHALYPIDTMAIPMVLCTCAVKSIMVFATIFAFYSTETIMKFPTASALTYSTREKIFLASVLAIYSKYCFAVMAGCLSYDETWKSVVAKNCINLIQTYYQSVFLLHVPRCVQNANYNKCVGFVCICVFLGITNFSYWVIDSFIIDQAFSTFQNIHFNVLKTTVWHLLHDIFGPLTLYYNFSSAFAFHSLYMRFSPK